MITLIAKLFMVVGLHIAITIVWQKRTGAAWRALLFALVAFFIHFFARIPLAQQVAPYFDQLDGRMVLGVYTPLIPQWLLFGLFREGIRWATFRFLATSVQSWRDGVMFGIGYSSIAFLLMLWGLLAPQTIDPGLVPASPIRRDLLLDDLFVWEHAIFLAWHLVILVMILNVGTSLAVLYSVRRRQVWPLLVAVVIYALPNAAPWVAINNIPDAVMEQFMGRWSIIFWREFLLGVAALPAIGMLFLLRKPLDRLAAQ